MTKPILIGLGLVVALSAVIATNALIAIEHNTRLIACHLANPNPTYQEQITDCVHDA